MELCLWAQIVDFAQTISINKIKVKINNMERASMPRTEAKRLNAQKAIEMYRRANSGGFGADYQPAIKVSRAEAPSQSKPCLLYCARLGRDLHLLSQGEFAAAIRALFIPKVVDLHEQKLLSPLEQQHPAASHPAMSGKNLPSIRGTLSVCEELGIKHPHVVNSDGIQIPYPYVGDLLLYFGDSKSTISCVNWTIKRVQAQFGEQETQIHPENKSALRAKQKAANRLLIERMYYASADIPTYSIAFDDFNRTVTANLFRLYVANSRAPKLDQRDWVMVGALVEQGMSRYYSVNRMAKDLALGHGLPVADALNLIQAVIWRGSVQVDLYSTIFPDRPLSHSKSDLAAQLMKKWGPLQ